MYHEYVSVNGRLHRRHYNGRVADRLQIKNQVDQYRDPDSDFWQGLALKSCDQFHDLPGMTAQVYETFIAYYHQDNPETKTWKEINTIFQSAIHAFQQYPEASAEALAYAAGILPDELCTCNGMNQSNCRYCAGVAQAFATGMAFTTGGERSFGIPD
jgi:hypothetical protein